MTARATQPDYRHAYTFVQWTGPYRASIFLSPVER
jgi:hypothetical protein